MRKFALSLFCGAAVSMLGGATAFAQTADGTSTKATTSGHSLEEIVVTARRRAESLQDVPSGWNALAGQVALLPVQFSATSHTPADARHTVLDDTKTSAGQLVDVPSHCSPTSQTPATTSRSSRARRLSPRSTRGCSRPTR